MTDLFKKRLWIYFKSILLIGILGILSLSTQAIFRNELTVLLPIGVYFIGLGLSIIFWLPNFKWYWNILWALLICVLPEPTSIFLIGSYKSDDLSTFSASLAYEWGVLFFYLINIIKLIFYSELINIIYRLISSMKIKNKKREKEEFIFENEESLSKILEKDVEQFKSLYATYSIERLNEILNDNRYSVLAKKAAGETIENRIENGISF